MEPRPLRVLIACEESQTVCKEFRARGHEAYSCDLQACSGGRPDWHIMHDAVEVAYSGCWDLMVAHPPCTFFAAPGMHYLKSRPERRAQLDNSFKMLQALWNAPILHIAIENPIGWLNTNWRKPSQIIQPYYFGDPELKTTCLWLRGLPRLNGLAAVGENPGAHRPKPEGYRKNKDGSMRGKYFCTRIDDHYSRKNNERQKLKSKTFPGIAACMARTWSPDLTIL